MAFQIAVKGAYFQLHFPQLDSKSAHCHHHAIWLTESLIYGKSEWKETFIKISYFYQLKKNVII